MKRLPPFTERSPFHPIRSDDPAVVGSVITTLCCITRAPSTKPESWYAAAVGKYVRAVWCQVPSHAGRAKGAETRRMRIAVVSATTKLPDGVTAMAYGAPKVAAVPAPSA